MKKKIAAVAMVLAMTASLAACGKTKVQLCDYRGIALQSVAAADIETKIETYVSNYFYEMKEENEVQSGDTAYINFIGRRDGVAFEGGTSETEEGYELVIGSNSFIPGFEDGVIGMKKGETKFIDVVFPETYRNTDLAGQPAQFEVTLINNKRKYKLELNDENVKKILSYDTVQAFRDAVAHDLNYESYTGQISEYLIANCKVTNLPKDEVDEYCNTVYDTAVKEVKQLAQAYGATEEEVLSSLTQFKNFEELREYCLKGAEQNVTYQCIIKEIAAKEGINVDDAVIAEKGPEYAERYGFESIDELIAQVSAEKGADKAKEIVAEQILLDLTHDYLIENAKIF